MPICVPLTLLVDAKRPIESDSSVIATTSASNREPRLRQVDIKTAYNRYRPLNINTIDRQTSTTVLSEPSESINMPGFEPKTPVSLKPPKDDPISVDYLSKCDGTHEGYPTYVAIKVSIIQTNVLPHHRPNEFYIFGSLLSPATCSNSVHVMECLSIYLPCRVTIGSLPDVGNSFRGDGQQVLFSWCLIPWQVISSLASDC